MDKVKIALNIISKVIKVLKKELFGDEKKKETKE